jgi:EAL and modified HD-GYP domain-containing signal transduction protein
MTNSRILFARQPIFDRNMEVTAYELLYRQHQSDIDTEEDGASATSQVLINAFTELMITDVADSKKAFINFTRQLILNPPPFEPSHLVIEVLENIEASPEIIEALSDLKDKGFTIALDDFEYHERFEPLLAIADIVKLDVLTHSSNALAKLTSKLKARKFILLAEKIETHAMYETCKKLGFDLFQGYFLCEPQLVRGNPISESKQAVFNVLHKLQDQDVLIEDLHNVIAQDPVLSYKLLRLVNSAFYMSAQPIDSLRQAITRLGLEKIRSWATLMALANMGHKPEELSILALIRARFCQELSQLMGAASAGDHFFTIGLLSTLDAFLDLPLTEIIETIKLSDEIEAALLRKEGPAGLALATILHYEKAQWQEIEWDQLKQHHIDEANLENAYRQSLQWARQSYAEVIKDQPRQKSP